MRFQSAPRTILLAAFLASVAASMADRALSAEVKKCTAVQELAKAGHYSSDTVNVTADDDNDVCSFSVNGATVDSPPQADVINALDSLIGSVTSPGSFFTQQQTDIEALALLLLASSPVVNIDEMVSFLSQHGSELAGCRDASLQHTSLPLDGANDTRFSCAVYPRGSSGLLYSFGPISGLAQDPAFHTQVVIGARPASMWHLLSFPAPDR